MLQFVVVGLVLGSIYALAASGLVITYVSTGVLNFAFGSLAYFIARTYYYIHVEKGGASSPSAAVCLFVLAPASACSSTSRSSGSSACRRSSSRSSSPSASRWSIPAARNMIYGNEEIFFRPPASRPQPVHVYQVFGTAVTLDQVITYACVLAIVVFGALILRFTEAGLERAGDGRLRGDDVAVGQQPVAHRGRRVDGLDVPRRARRNPRRPGHRPRRRQVHAAHRGRVRRGHRRPTAQPARSRSSSRC